MATNGVGMRIFIGVVTAALIVDVATSVAAEDAVHEDAVAVDIIPDSPADATGLRMEKGAALPIAVPVREPMRAGSGAGR